MLFVAPLNFLNLLILTDSLTSKVYEDIQLKSKDVYFLSVFAFTRKETHKEQSKS